MRATKVFDHFRRALRITIMIMMVMMMNMMFVKPNDMTRKDK